jgi:uncharacterized membrane protein
MNHWKRIVGGAAAGAGAMYLLDPGTARAMFARETWPPSSRVIAIGTGSLLGAWGLKHRGALGTLASTAGGVLLLRALTNLSARRLLGIGAGPRAIDITKTITIDAPVHEVYALLADIENFPRFMEHVREVTVNADNPEISHWKVEGPAGFSASWDALTTSLREDESIAWKTVPEAVIEHAGKIRLDPEGSGTRIHVQMTYNPVAGALGHVIAKLFGSDPKSRLDDDLKRLKALLEKGKTRVHGDEISREEITPPAPFLPRH